MTDARHAWELSGGAQPLADGGTRFRLWAPAQRAPMLQLADGRQLPMHARDEGWFEVVADCGAGTRYRYRLDDGLLVPDPQSRAQAQDVHGDSVVVDPHAYRWRHGDWRGRPWTETVLYELHAGCAGGFEALRQRLPELAELGVTAVELMPVNDFPGQRNWGYDGVLPYAPDSAYGSPEQLKALVDDAHGLGLMMFLDVVYNHFGPDGNYLHAYAPQFFRADRPTLWGPSIDFRRPQVRRYFTDNALYWLQEYRFDGLRFDAVHAIEDPDWLQQTAAAIRCAVEPERHVHLVLENDANVSELLRRSERGGFDAQWNDDGHHALHVLLTGESEGYYAGFSEAPAAQLARCLAEGFAYQGEHSVVHGEPRGTPSAELPPHAFVLFLQNHDQTGNRAFGERLTTLAEPEALRAATALLLLAPQIPMLFMGEDWGCTQPFLFFTDHNPELAKQVREGRCREFARFAAFGDATRAGGIPDPNDPQTFARACPRWPEAPEAAQRAQTRRAEVAQLLRLRREHVVPGLPGARSIGAEVLTPQSLQAHWRLGDGRRLTLASNFGADEVAWLPPTGMRRIHASCPAATPTTTHLPAHCTLAFIGDTPAGDAAT